MTEYTLYVARNNTYVKFSSVSELKYYLSRYFAPSESNIVAQLTTFKMKTETNNGYSYKYSENNWRDIKTSCYIFED